MENLGFIKSDAGDVILVGRTVKNAGAIEAPAGAAGLAAGDDVLLSATGSDRLSVRLPANAPAAATTAETGVDNSGIVKAAQAQLAAAGGHVYALAINNGGVVEATGFAQRADGRIVLTAEGGAIAVAGKLTARDADGSGGTILVGGGYQGKDAAVPNARTTAIAASATLDASAIENPESKIESSNGGQVIVWADERTEFHGAITARGGATGGDGGFVEVSGKQDLLFKGTADTRAPAGATGTLLLDPANITVDVTSLAVGTGVNALSMSDLVQQLQTSNVAISTSNRPGADAGDITFIGTTSGLFNFPNALTFTADRDILFNAPLTIAATANQGAITFNAGRTLSINQPLLFAATSQGGHSNSTVTGAAGPSFTFGAVTFNAADDLFLNAPLVINLSSTGGNTANATDGYSGGGGPGGAGGDITFAGLKLAAGDELYIRNRLDVDVTSLGGNGGQGFYAGPADPGGPATRLGAGGAGGAITMGEIRLESATDPLSTSKRLIIQSSSGSSGTPAALTFDYTSRGGEGGDKASGGQGGKGGAITTAGLVFEANAGVVGMGEGTTFAVNARSIGGSGGDHPGSGSEFLPASLKVIATGGAGGAVAIGDTAFNGRAVKLYAESVILDATVQSGLGGGAAFNSAGYTGGVGGDAGQARLGALAFTAVDGIYDTPLLTRSTASVITPSEGFHYASGNASAADVTASPFKLTSGTGPITPAAHGVGSSIFYSDNTIHIIAGTSLDLRGSAISTKQALFLVVDNLNPANPAFNVANNLNFGSAVVQAGPGATQQARGNYGPHIPDYVRIYGVQPSSVALGSFTPVNDVRDGNNYYGVGPFAGLIPGIFYKNVIPHDPLTVTANSFTKLYGAPLPAFTATYAGFVNGDDLGDFTLPTFTTTATLGSNVGSYSIMPGGMTGPANYSFNYVAGTLTINPALLTVTAGSASKLYGAALPAFGATVTGLVNGDTAAAVVTAAPGTAATAASNVGTYAITPGATLRTSNYTLNEVNGSLAITPATLTVTAGDTTRTYGAANPAFATNLTGLVNGDTASVVTIAPTTTAVAGSNVGSYTIAPGATLNTGNYILTQNNGTLTIGTATLNVRADDATKVYAAPMPTLTGTALNLVNNDAQSSVVAFAPTVAGATASSNVGTYVIAPNPTLLGATPNYALGTIANGTLTISPATLNVAAASASKVYGAALPTFGGTALNLVNGDAQSSVVSFAPTTTATAGSNVGTYTITPNAALLTANYVLGTASNGTLTITQAPLIITADNLSRLYGFANPALTATFTGLVNGDTTSAVTGLSLATSATPASAAGNYAITNSGALSALNYVITFNPGTLVVGSPAPLAITANDFLLTYGFAALPAFTATAAGLVGGDDVSVITGLQFSTTATVGANVGNYAIVPSGASAPANYIISYVNGSLRVDPAVLNVAANSAGKVYGAALPTFGGTALNLVNGDAQSSVVSFAPTTTALAGSNVGTYAITPNATLLSPNYTLGTQGAGTLTITPATLAIAANNATKVYGAALPAFTGSVNGLVNGDVATSVVALGFTSTGAAGSNVGTYTITPTASLLGLTPNYTIGSLANGTLTVTRAPLTITADSFSRALNAANPAFTATYSGLVNGDTAAAVSGLMFTTAATPGSAAGTYAITPSSATAANYTLSYVPGSLIVRALNGLTFTAADATRIYGDANPAFSLKSIDGLFSGDTLTSVQFKTDATLGSNVGRYAITPFGAVVATAVPREYDISYLPGTLTINPAVLTVSLNGATLHRSARSWQSLGGLESVTTTADSLTGTSRYLVNGGGADSFTYTISGFKNTADIASLDRAGAAAFSYGRLAFTTYPAPGTIGVITTIDYGVSGPLMGQGGLKLNGSAAGNYTFALQGYTPDAFGYVPNTALTLTTLTANAYPDSRLILPGILLYDPAERQGGRGNLLAQFAGTTNYYNQAQLAGLTLGYETNWQPGVPVGTYWTLPTLAGLDSGIVDPVANQSYDLGLPFYFPDLANPGREFAITKVRVGLVNVFERGQEVQTPGDFGPQPIQLLSENAGVRARLIDVGPIGAFGVPIGAQDVLYAIVDRMLADAKIDVGPNRVQGVAQWILANGNSPEMRNALAAYMAQEAIEIVTSGRARTAGEQVFLDSLTNQINQNRAAAANEALAAYNQWKADQAAFRENMKGYGALLNFGDRIPPEILALASAQVPSEQILRVSGAVTGVMAASGGVAMGLILQSKEIMVQVMPFAARTATNMLSSGLSIAGGAAGAAPIANVVASLATIGMAIERIVSADADQKAFNEAIDRLKQPTSIESALGMRALIGGQQFFSDAPTIKDQHGITWEFSRTQDNLALMAAVTATISSGSNYGSANSSLGLRQ